MDDPGSDLARLRASRRLLSSVLPPETAASKALRQGPLTSVSTIPKENIPSSLPSSLSQHSSANAPTAGVTPQSLSPPLRQADAPSTHKRAVTTYGGAFTPSVLVELAADTAPPMRLPAAGTPTATTAVVAAEPSAAPTSQHETLHRSQAIRRRASRMPESTAGETDWTHPVVSSLAGSERVSGAAWQPPAKQVEALQQTRALEVKRLRTIMQQSRLALASRRGLPEGDSAVKSGGSGSVAVSRLVPPDKGGAPAVPTASTDEAVKSKEYQTAESAIATKASALSRMLGGTATSPQAVAPAEEAAADVEAAAAQERVVPLLTVKHVKLEAPAVSKRLASVAASSRLAALNGSTVAVTAQGEVAKKRPPFKAVQEAPGVEAWRERPYTTKAGVKKVFIPKVVVKKKLPFGQRPTPKRASLPDVPAGGGGAPATEVVAAVLKPQEQEGEAGEEESEEADGSLPFSVATFPSQESGDSEFNLTASDFLERLPAAETVRSVSPSGERAATAKAKGVPSRLTYPTRAGKNGETYKALSEMFLSRMVEDGGALRGMEREPGAVTVEEEEAEEEEAEEEEAEEEEAEEEEPEGEEGMREVEEGEEEKEEDVEKEEETARVSAHEEERKMTDLARIAVPAGEEGEGQEAEREKDEEKEKEEEEVDLSAYERDRKILEREERHRARADRSGARRMWRYLGSEEEVAAASAAAEAKRKMLLHAAAEDEEEEELTFRAAPGKAAVEEGRRQIEEPRRKTEIDGTTRMGDKREVKSMDERADDLAAQEDYDRAALMLESEIEIPPSIPGLSPPLDRLRRERAELLLWVRRLRKGLTLRATERVSKVEGPSELVTESGTLVRLPLRRTETTAAEFARTYAAAAEALAEGEEARLESPLKAEGPFIEERLAKEMTMPSSAVFSLERRLQRQLRQLGQQRRHVTLLQKILHEQGTEKTAAERSTQVMQEGEEGEIGEVGGGTGHGDAAAVTQQILEEQCTTLLQRFEQEREYSEAYKNAWIEAHRSKEAVREKCDALRKKLQQLQAAKMTKEARQEEEEEKLRDCQEELQTQMQALARSQSSREQYEYQLLVLQERYEELRSYLREWQEKASSFEEGMIESRSNLQQQTALLQVERQASLRLRELLRERDQKVSHLEVAVQLERDKLLLEQRAAQQLRAAVAEQEMMRAAAEEKANEEKQKFEEEQEMHREVRQLLGQREEQLQQLREEVATLQASEAAASEKKIKMKKLATAAVKLLYQSGNRVAAAEKAMQKIEKRRQKALKLLQKARDITQQHQLSQQQQQQEQQELQQRVRRGTEQMREKDEEIANLKQAMQRLKSAAEAASTKQVGETPLEVHLQLEEERQRHKKEEEQQQKQLEEEQAARKESEEKLQEQQESSKRLQQKLAAFAFTSQGRSSIDSPEQLIRAMRGGLTVERNSPFKKRFSRVQLKLSSDRKTIIISSGRDPSKTEKKKSALTIKNIVSVEFGTASAACLARVKASGRYARSLRKVTPVVPWQCFAVYTPQGGEVFVAPSEAEAEAWVVGLGYLAPWVAPNIRSRHEFLVKRGFMKLHYYCQQKNISMVKLWKDAIAKTVHEGQRSRSQKAEEQREKVESPNQQQQEQQEQQQQQWTAEREASAAVSSSQSPSEASLSD